MKKTTANQLLLFPELSARFSSTRYQGSKIKLVNWIWEQIAGYARGILLVPIVLGVLAPLFLKIQMYVASEQTYHILSAICHQSSLRSFWIAGAPMGICARDVGIYLGLFWASCSSNILNRKWLDMIAIALFFIVPLLIEKVVLSSFATTNITRLIIGILAGLGFGIVFLSIFIKLIGWLKLSQKEVKQ